MIDLAELLRLAEAAAEGPWGLPWFTKADVDEMLIYPPWAEFIVAASPAAVQQLVEAFRRHVVDWGDCDHPEDCDCSHVAALRLFGGEA